MNSLSWASMPSPELTLSLTSASILLFRASTLPVRLVGMLGRMLEPIGLLEDVRQMFMEYFPNSTKKQEAQDMIFALQDKLVLKELYSARLYYNLGNYLGNNYESCVITAQNALKDYPYTDYREELSILVLRARHEMAIYSVEDKKMDRYRETIDEYYAFKNEFPESKYLKEAEKIFNESQKVIKD